MSIIENNFWDFLLLMISPNIKPESPATIVKGRVKIKIQTKSSKRLDSAIIKKISTLPTGYKTCLDLECRISLSAIIIGINPIAMGNIQIKLMLKMLKSKIISSFFSQSIR